MNANVREQLPIAGEHCESSAMMNAMPASGYGITEEQIIGAGSAPGFVYEKTAFPFLGGRSHEMRESFLKATNIPCEMREHLKDPEWKKVSEILHSGTPVVLRVDMRYLPYLYNGKFGPKYMSFGWHYVTLFEIDEKSKLAWVSDTNHHSLQRISIKALSKARFSKTKIYPPSGEYYYFRKTDSPLSLNWAEIALGSLAEYHRNMSSGINEGNRLTGLPGLNQLSREIVNLPASVPPFLIPAILDFHHGCIETNGTGGAAFRRLYYRFLEGHLFFKHREALLKKAKECEIYWQTLAVEYEQGAKNYKTGSVEDKKAILSSVAKAAERVYSAECGFVEEIEKSALYLM